jgi:hypothetical protein
MHHIWASGYQATVLIFTRAFFPSVTRWAGWFKQCSDKATGCEFSEETTFFSPSLCSDRIWNCPSPLSSGYHGLFPLGKVVQLTSHLHLMQKANMELYLHSSTLHPHRSPLSDYSGFPTNFFQEISSFLNACCICRPSHCPWVFYSSNIWWTAKIISHLLCDSLSLSLTSFFLGSNILFVA